MSLLALFRWQAGITARSTTKTVVEYAYVGGSEFSLAISDSDTTQTQSLLDPLIGTLVKYGPTGAPEPYLAKSWTVENKGLTYIFQLRTGLKCSDGYELTASNFVTSLRRQLAYFAKKNGLEFEKLKGWTDCIKDSNSSQLGLVADDKAGTVRFEFVQRPDDLLNFLRMPYFGFYSPNNFGTDGKQKNEFDVVSCGAFEIKSANARRVELKKRNDWDLAAAGQFDEVVFTKLAEMPKGTPALPTIVDSPLASDFPAPNGYFKVFGAPTMLTAVVLSPKLPLFKDLRRRQWLADLLRSRHKEFFDGLESSNSINGFFETPYKSRNINLTSADFLEFKSRPVTIYLSGRLESTVKKRLTDFFVTTFSELGMRTEFPTLDLKQGAVADKLYGNSLVDIRVSSVSLLSTFYPSVYRMMFCSELGVSFPDPNNKIRSLVDKFEKDPNADEKEYRPLVDAAVIDESAVIPIGRKRLIWWYSDHFDKSSIMPIPNYPRFELIKVK